MLPWDPLLGVGGEAVEGRASTVGCVGEEGTTAGGRVAAMEEL